MNLQIKNIADEEEEPINEFRVGLTEDDVEGLVHGSGITVEFPEPLEATIHGIYVTNEDVALDMDWVRERTPMEDQNPSLIQRLLGAN